MIQVPPREDIPRVAREATPFERKLGALGKKKRFLTLLNPELTKENAKLLKNHVE